jgi:hypothetical protein
MLPPANENGDLPPGVHLATWAEVEERFGSANENRMHALAKLKFLHDLARRTGFLRNFYVFGSFVSAATKPHDVDIVLVMGSNFRVEDSPRESRTLFSHPDAQARYGATVFWLRKGVLPTEAMREFLEVWQAKRDGTLRGILEVL